MLRDLCRLSGVPFARDRGKRWVAALFGGLTPSILKAIPVVGFTVGTPTNLLSPQLPHMHTGRYSPSPSKAGATLLTFDPQKVKSYFAAYYKAGGKQAAERY
jgi:hypothetical protein